MGLNFCFFHHWLLLEDQADHYWLKIENSNWYEYSIGKVKCKKCGKTRDRYRHQLNYMPQSGNNIQIEI